VVGAVAHQSISSQAAGVESHKQLIPASTHFYRIVESTRSSSRGRDIFKPYQRPQGVHCGRIARQSIALNFTHAQTRGTPRKKNMCGGGTVASAAAPTNRIQPAAAAPRAPTIDIQTRQARNIVQDPRGCRRTLHTEAVTNDALQCSTAALQSAGSRADPPRQAGQHTHAASIIVPRREPPFSNTITNTKYTCDTGQTRNKRVSNRGSTCRADPISRHRSHTPSSACTQRMQIQIQLQSIPRSPVRGGGGGGGFVLVWGAGPGRAGGWGNEK
jgi:hypothetical protein